MTFLLLPQARDELREAALQYRSIHTDLGFRFRHEVKRVINRIVADPFLWRERTGGYRRVNCAVFPYYVAYVVRGEVVLVVAVAHGHRRPLYWKQRLD